MYPEQEKLQKSVCFLPPVLFDPHKDLTTCVDGNIASIKRTGQLFTFPSISFEKKSVPQNDFEHSRYLYTYEQFIEGFKIRRNHSHFCHLRNNLFLF